MQIEFAASATTSTARPTHEDGERHPLPADWQRLQETWERRDRPAPPRRDLI